MAQGRIACLLGPGFEDSEFRVPYDAVKNAGDHVIPLSAVTAVTEQKVMVDLRKLPDSVREAVKHAHDAEDFP